KGSPSWQVFCTARAPCAMMPDASRHLPECTATRCSPVNCHFWLLLPLQVHCCTGAKSASEAPNTSRHFDEWAATRLPRAGGGGGGACTWNVVWAVVPPTLTCLTQVPPRGSVHGAVTVKIPLPSVYCP